MELYIKEQTQDRLTIVEEGLFARGLAFLMFFAGGLYLLFIILSGLEADPVKPSLLVVAGFVYFFVATTSWTVLCKQSGELRLERRRILPFTSTSRVLSLEEVVVPEVTFHRGSYGVGQMAILHLRLQGGERIKLHAENNDPGRVTEIHDKIWKFLDLSPGQDPPDPSG